MKRAFILGNGKSRKTLDIPSLKGNGLVIGCNALYRDYYHQYDLPDYLVAIDNKIITEIEHSDFPSKRFLEPPEDEKWEPVELHWGRSATADWNPARPRSNAGMNAILEAIKLGCDDLFIFGFDFLVIDQSVALSNLYDGTNGYELQTRANIQDTRNRMKFLGWVIENNPEISFTFCYPRDIIRNGIYKPEADNCKIISLESI